MVIRLLNFMSLIKHHARNNGENGNPWCIYCGGQSCGQRKGAVVRWRAIGHERRRNKGIVKGKDFGGSEKGRREQGKESLLNNKINIQTNKEAACDMFNLNKINMTCY